MATSPSGDSLDVPPTLPQNRNSSVVMDLRDSPGCISIQDSPLVETHNLQNSDPQINPEREINSGPCKNEFKNRNSETEQSNIFIVSGSSLVVVII